MNRWKLRSPCWPNAASYLCNQPQRSILICALGIATIGAVTDVRGRRIPSRLPRLGGRPGDAVCFVGMAGTPEWRGGAAAGRRDFLSSLSPGDMGGGDAKLMAAVGAWAGTAQAVPILIASAIVGRILALCDIVFRRRLFPSLLNTVKLIGYHLRFGLQPHPSLNIRQPSSLRVPCGLAVALRTLYCVGNTFWRG